MKTRPGHVKPSFRVRILEKILSKYIDSRNWIDVSKGKLNKRKVREGAVLFHVKF